MAQQKRAITNVAINTLQAARTRLSERAESTYLNTPLWNLIPVERPGLGTFAVDEYWRLYYDPELQWNVEEMCGVLEHEIWHLLNDHASRAKTKLGKDINNPLLARIWNIAADEAINSVLKEGKVRLPGKPVYPSNFGHPPNLSSEQYYDLHAKPEDQGGEGEDEGQKESPEGEGQAPGGSGSSQDSKGKSKSGKNQGAKGAPPPMLDGSASDGIQKDWEEPPPGEMDADGNESAPGVQPLERELIKRKVAEDILKASQARGDMANGMARWAQQILKPTVDWRRELQSVIRHAVEERAGDTDFSYSRLSRRNPPGILLPSMVEPVVHPVIVVDTSGSIGDQELQRAMSEVEGVIKSQGYDEVPVIFCDAVAYQAQRIRKASKGAPVGGGGTDMGEGIKSAVKLRPRPELIIVLTDGYTPWPNNPPPHTKVLVGILSPKDSNFASVDVPKWSKRINIPCG